jgi:hypothetical protein
MVEEKIEVIAYSGYRGEEVPRTILLHDERMEVTEILCVWTEERFEDRHRRRFFKVKDSDGHNHEIYYDEKAAEWFLLIHD